MVNVRKCLCPLSCISGTHDVREEELVNDDLVCDIVDDNRTEIGDTIQLKVGEVSDGGYCKININHNQKDFDLTDNYNGNMLVAPGDVDISSHSFTAEKKSPLRYKFSNRKNSYVIKENVFEGVENVEENNIIESMYKNKFNINTPPRQKVTFNYGVEIRDIFGDYIFGNPLRNRSECQPKDEKKEAEEMKKFWMIVNEQNVSNNQPERKESIENLYPQPLKWEILSFDAIQYLRDKEMAKYQRRVAILKNNLTMKKQNNINDPRSVEVINKVGIALKSINWQLGQGHHDQSFTHLFGDQKENEKISTTRKKRPTIKLNTTTEIKSNLNEASSAHMSEIKKDQFKTTKPIKPKARGNTNNSNIEMKKEKKKAKIFKELNKKIEQKAKKEEKRKAKDNMSKL